MVGVKRKLDLNILYGGCPSSQFHTANIVQVKYKQSSNETEQSIIGIYNSLATQYELWTSPRFRGWHEALGWVCCPKSVHTSVGPGRWNNSGLHRKDDKKHETRPCLLG